MDEEVYILEGKEYTKDQIEEFAEVSGKDFTSYMDVAGVEVKQKETTETTEAKDTTTTTTKTETEETTPTGEEVKVDTTETVTDPDTPSKDWSNERWQKYFEEDLKRTAQPYSQDQLLIDQYYDSVEKGEDFIYNFEGEDIKIVPGRDYTIKDKKFEDDTEEVDAKHKEELDKYNKILDPQLSSDDDVIFEERVEIEPIGDSPFEKMFLPLELLKDEVNSFTGKGGEGTEARTEFKNKFLSPEYNGVLQQNKQWGAENVLNQRLNMTPGYVQGVVEGEVTAFPPEMTSFEVTTSSTPLTDGLLDISYGDNSIESFDKIKEKYVKEDKKRISDISQSYIPEKYRPLAESLDEKYKEIDDLMKV